MPLRRPLWFMRVLIGVLLLSLTAVLVSSFAALQHLAQSAPTVAAAAGQRAMLQRVATAVLALSHVESTPAQRAAQREQLRDVLSRMETTQHALAHGARFVDAHGHAVATRAVPQRDAALVLEARLADWRTRLEPVLHETAGDDARRDAAAFVLAHAEGLSEQLLAQMAGVEQEQRRRVEDFQALQLIALALLALLFGLSGFAVLRRLRRQELANQQAQQALAAARDQAEKASRAKSEFLARMSHELRTPLNAVLGLSQVLRSSASAFSAEERNHLQTIERAGRHLLALIDDTLDLSRIEAGEMRVERAPVNLLTAVSAARLALDPQATQAGVVWRVTPLAPGMAPWVWGDALRVRQVLLNLMSNAIKYNRSGGPVGIAIERSGSAWCVRVSDEGAGLDARQVSHLFEPYNRLGAERGPVPGTGIGLAISNRLASLMGGGLGVASTPGRGSTFTLSLPALEADTPHDEGPITDFGTLAPSERGHGARLLYVEDNEVNVIVFEACLARRPGVTLRVARDGAQALEAAARERFDLVVLDLNLPDTDGLTLLADLKRAGHGGAAALLTADALPATAHRARAAGFDVVWTKPMEPGAMLAHIDRLLQERLALEPL